MKLLTMLGTYDYQYCTYHTLGNSYNTCYFSVALAKAINPKQVSILMTKEAKEKHWENCKEELEREGFACTALSIPSGQSENELWDIFSTITEHIEDYEELAFDITHSFRSIPIILMPEG